MLIHRILRPKYDKLHKLKDSKQRGVTRFILQNNMISQFTCVKYVFKTLNILKASRRLTDKVFI